MEKLEALLAQLGEINTKLDALLSHDELTADQEAEHNRLVAEHKKTKAAITREQEKLARAAEHAELERQAAVARAEAERAANRALQSPNTLSGREPPTSNGPSMPGSPGRVTVPAEPLRCGTLRHFKGVRNGLTAVQRAHRFGQWALSVLREQMPIRFGKHPACLAASEFVARNMAVSSVDTSGYQYLIPIEFSADIIDLREKFGVARRLFKMEPMISDTKRIPRRRGGLTAYWTTEGAAITESNKTWDDVQLTAKDLTALSRASAQVNADTVVNWGDDLAGEIAYAFAYAEDSAAFNGDGTSTYGRVVGVRTKLLLVDGSNPSVGLVTGSGSSWAGLVMGDFEKVIGTLPQFADSDQVCWVMHRTFFFSVCQPLQTALGGVTWLESAMPPMAGEADQPGGRMPWFLGYPVIFAQVMPSTAAGSQVCTLLGNFAQGAAFGDRQQVEIAFSEHASIGGQNVFERNQIAIRGTERIDINVHDVGFATANVQAASPGPIVGLETHS